MDWSMSNDSWSMGVDASVVGGNNWSSMVGYNSSWGVDVWGNVRLDNGVWTGIVRGSIWVWNSCISPWEN